MAEYRVQVASDPDYEEILIEIYVGDEFVAQISQEAGTENALLEFGPPGSPTKVELKTFEEALALAKNRLLRSARQG